MTRTAEDLAEELQALRTSNFKLDDKIRALTDKLIALNAELDAADKAGIRYVSTSAIRWAIK